MKLHTLLSLVFILVSGNSFTAHQQDFYPEELACYHPFFSPAFNTPCLRTEEAQAGVTSYVAQNGPMNSIIPLTLSTDTALHMAINIARPDLASLFLDVLDPGNRTVVCTCTDGYHNTILLTTLKFLKRLLARRQALPQQIYQGTIEQSHSEVISNTIAFLYKILPHSNLLYVNQASPYPSEHHSAISYFQNRLYTGEQRQHLDEYIATYLANHSDARPLPEFFEATHQRDSEITETLTKQGEELQTVKEKLAQQAAELAAAQAKQQKLEEHIARLTITQASSPDPEFLRHSSQQDLPTSLIQACGTSNSPITSPDHNSSANQGKQITTSLPRSLLPKIDNTGPLDQSESKPQSPTPPPLAQKGTAKNQGSNTSEVPQDIPSSVTAEDNESDFIAEQPRALSRPDDQQGSSAAKLKRLRQQQALQEATRQEEQKKRDFSEKKQAQQAIEATRRQAKEQEKLATQAKLRAAFFEAIEKNNVSTILDQKSRMVDREKDFFETLSQDENLALVQFFIKNLTQQENAEPTTNTAVQPEEAQGMLSFFTSFFSNTHAIPLPKRKKLDAIQELGLKNFFILLYRANIITYIPEDSKQPLTDLGLVQFGSAKKAPKPDPKDNRKQNRLSTQNIATSIAKLHKAPSTSAKPRPKTSKDFTKIPECYKTLLREMEAARCVYALEEIDKIADVNQTIWCNDELSTTLIDYLSYLHISIDIRVAIAKKIIAHQSFDPRIKNYSKNSSDEIDQISPLDSYARVQDCDAIVQLLLDHDLMNDTSCIADAALAALVSNAKNTLRVILHHPKMAPEIHIFYLKYKAITQHNPQYADLLCSLLLEPVKKGELHFFKRGVIPANVSAINPALKDNLPLLLLFSGVPHEVVGGMFINGIFDVSECTATTLKIVLTKYESAPELRPVIARFVRLILHKLDSQISPDALGLQAWVTLGSSPSAFAERDNENFDDWKKYSRATTSSSVITTQPTITSMQSFQDDPFTWTLRNPNKCKCASVASCGFGCWLASYAFPASTCATVTLPCVCGAIGVSACAACDMLHKARIAAEDTKKEFVLKRAQKTLTKKKNT